MRTIRNSLWLVTITITASIRRSVLQQMFYLSSLPIRSSNTLDRCFSLLSPLDTDSKSWSNFLFHTQKEEEAANKSETELQKRGRCIMWGLTVSGCGLWGRRKGFEVPPYGPGASFLLQLSPPGHLHQGSFVLWSLACALECCHFQGFVWELQPAQVCVLGCEWWKLPFVQRCLSDLGSVPNIPPWKTLGSSAASGSRRTLGMRNEDNRATEHTEQLSTRVHPPDTLHWLNCEHIGWVFGRCWFLAAPSQAPKWDSPVRSWSGRRAAAGACAGTFSES